MGKSYTAPHLDAKTAAAHARGDFDFLMPFAKGLLRSDEVGDVLNRTPQFVRELIADGRLEAHCDSGRGAGLRLSPLVTRRSVILYLAETANYDPAYFIIRLEAQLSRLSPAGLDRFIATATRLRNQIR